MQEEVGIPLELKQGMGPHLHMRWETRGSSRVVVGNSGFLSRYDWNLWAPFTCMKGVKPHLQFREGTRDCSLDAEGTNGLKSHGRGTHLVFLKLQWEGWDSSPGTPGELKEPLLLPQGSHVSIQVVRGSARLLLGHSRGIRPQFTWKGESQLISLVAAGRLGSLELQWGPEGASHPVSGKSGILSSCEGPLEIPVKLMQGMRASSRVEVGNSGLLSSFDMDLGILM